MQPREWKNIYFLFYLDMAFPSSFNLSLQLLKMNKCDSLNLFVFLLLHGCIIFSPRSGMSTWDFAARKIQDTVVRIFPLIDCLVRPKLTRPKGKVICPCLNFFFSCDCMIVSRNAMSVIVFLEMFFYLKIY
jgi:hypothetical protein